METTLLFVRHTDVHNPGEVLYGRLPRFRLSALGVTQAEVTRSALENEPIRVFYTSPQLRARQTTKYLASSHLDAKIVVTRLLQEVKTSWQGRSHSELEEIGFNFYDHPLEEDDETLEHVWARVRRFVFLARRRHPGSTVTAVTHGDIAILARAIYAGMPLEVSSMRAPNPYTGKGSITRLTFTGNLNDETPVRVCYFDPNGSDKTYSRGWVDMLSSAGGGALRALSDPYQ